MSKEFKIHNQISEKQIITSIERDFSNFMQNWFQLHLHGSIMRIIHLRM